MALFDDTHTGPPPDDRETLERFRRGDRDVLAALFRAHRPTIDRMLRKGFFVDSGAGGHSVRGIADEVARQDLVQETFARAFAEAARTAYDGLQPFERWVRTIARNVTLNHVSAFAVSRHAGSPEDVGLDEPAAEASAPDEVEWRELVSLAERFTQGLQGRERQVLAGLWRRHVDDVSQTEVARELGVSHVTLRKLERSVLTRFEAELRRHGYLEHRAPLTGLAAGRSAAVLLAALAAAASAGAAAGAALSRGGPS